MALKFTVHVVQSFIKGHRKSGVISIKHSRDITSPLTVVRFLPVTATYAYGSTCTYIQMVGGGRGGGGGGGVALETEHCNHLTQRYSVYKVTTHTYTGG